MVQAKLHRAGGGCAVCRLVGISGSMVGGVTARVPMSMPTRSSQLRPAPARMPRHETGDEPMTLQKILLSTTAVLGAGMLAVSAAGPAGAAEVKAGGLPRPHDHRLRRAFEAFGGEHGRPAARRRRWPASLDFRNDTEVHVIARGKSEETGLEYGATIEFEADTNSTPTPTRPGSSCAAAGARSGFGDEDGVGRQQRGRRADDRRRHRRHRRLGRGDLRGAGWSSSCANTRRRDQDPLLHAELRRLQPRRRPTRRPSSSRQRREQRPVLRPQERPDGHGGRELRRGRRWSTTASSAASASWPRWSASTAS